METTRLYLRVITTEDAAFLYKLMNTDKWHRFVGDRKIHSIDTAREYIRLRTDADLSTKGFVNHMMTEKATGQAVGTCSLHDREGVGGIDIGYALLPEFEGRGYASEGAKAMIDLAFGKYQQSSVSAIVDDDNSRSSLLLEKLGFVRSSDVRLPNGTRDIRQYILKRPS